MGLILDFVPNHMGIGKSDNRWWLDVLEWGPRSPHAASFDIAWDTLPFFPGGGVLVPILGRPYGEALEGGDIVVRFDPEEGSFSAWYFDHRLPLRPDRYRDMLRLIVETAGAQGMSDGRALLGLGRHPAGTRADAAALKAGLAEAGAADLIERGLAAFRPGETAAGVYALHRLLERQHYRIASWRVATSDINYRRFFDVNDLAGIRVEHRATFAAVHRLVLRLIGEGRLHGIRLDHIDGLADPAQYARRLRRAIGDERSPRNGGRFYTVVEKILADGEPLPLLSGVAGTTGYEWLNTISRILFDERGRCRLEETAQNLTGQAEPFPNILREAKRTVLSTMLASEFTVLVRMLARIAAGHWRSRDFTEASLRDALELFVISFPIYRTYVTAEGASVGDRRVIEAAIDTARAGWTGPEEGLFDLLRDALTLDLVAPGRTGYSRPRVRRFALKVQQFTGPMMAKSLEDTAFYRYVPLLALNEVGGDPTLPALTLAEFHSRAAARARDVPHGMTATATHDTKRGEDARARLLALSELAGEWRTAVETWMQLSEAAAGDGPPSAGHRYLIFQTLLGAWPAEGPADGLADRMVAYAVKAAREGKRETSWINPDEAYEAALIGFVRAILDRDRSPVLLESFSAFARRAALVGALNSLSQLTLKATLPGVPDFYQGSELWDLALVDPDNRRPVDFNRRAELLREIGDTPDWKALAESWTDGRIKLALTRLLLAIRRRFARLFREGGYVPLPVDGPDAGHVIAFARNLGREVVIVLAGRHFARSTGQGRDWSPGRDWDASVDLSRWSAVRTLLGAGGPVARNVQVRDAFGPLPVALFHGSGVRPAHSSTRKEGP